MKKLLFVLMIALSAYTVVTINGCKKDDTTPPVITISGNNPASVILTHSYTDAGATANDDNDGNVTVSSSGTVDVNTAGTYTITYTASDAAGNHATASRTVNVVIARENYVWAAYAADDSSTTNSTIGAFTYSGTITAGSAADAIIISDFSGTLQNATGTVTGGTLTIPNQTVGSFTNVHGSGTMNNTANTLTIDYTATLGSATDSYHAIFHKQ